MGPTGEDADEGTLSHATTTEVPHDCVSFFPESVTCDSGPDKAILLSVKLLYPRKRRTKSPTST